MYFKQGKDYPWTPRDGFDLFSSQASFAWPHVNLSRPLRARNFGLFKCIASLSNSTGFISLAGKASLVSISDAILFLPSQHVYLPLEFESRGKSCVGKGAWRPRYHLVPHTTFVYYIVWKVNLIKIITEKFVWALRTATTNCSGRIVLLIAPYKHCNFTGSVLWSYLRAWVTYGEICRTYRVVETCMATV